jgi:hypothetical protein
MPESKKLSEDMRLEFLLLVTDYLKGHWEDPEWGRRDSMIYGAINELANKIENSEARAAIQKAVATHTQAPKIRS